MFELFTTYGTFKCFSPVWVQRCNVRSDFWLKCVPHTVHWNYASPVWVAICLVRCPFRLNLLPHSVHSNGFSPLWIQRCVVRFASCLKLFPQMVHSKGSPPVWIRICLMRVIFWLKVFPQAVHLNRFSGRDCKMIGEYSHLVERLATHPIFNWFISGMSTEVFIQIIIFVEMLTTYRAFK